MVLSQKLTYLRIFLDNKYNLTIIIKANKKLFNFVLIINIYIKIFIF